VPEALGEAEAVIDGERAEHRPGRVSLRLEQLGEGRDAVREDVGSVVPHAVFERIEARQHGRVRGEGDGNRRVRLFEEYPFLREAVEVRRRLFVVSVAGEAVAPRRVEREEDEVEGRPARGDRRPGIRGVIDSFAGRRRLGDARAGSVPAFPRRVPLRATVEGEETTGNKRHERRP
jgi:hypothetical protein